MLKRKDGSIYRLERPSSSQSFWEDSPITHNFKWKKEVVVSKNAPIEQKETPPPKNEFIEEIQKEIQIEELNKNLVEKTRPKLKNKILIHCLPVTIQEHNDDFYGEKYNKINYSPKITFEAILIDDNGLEMSFWTNIKLENGSIVYPSRYVDGRPLNEYRWWKITNKESKEGGFIYYTMLSDQHPDFSD